MFTIIQLSFTWKNRSKLKFSSISNSSNLFPSILRTGWIIKQKVRFRTLFFLRKKHLNRVLVKKIGSFLKWGRKKYQQFSILLSKETWKWIENYLSTQWSSFKKEKLGRFNFKPSLSLGQRKNYRSYKSKRRVWTLKKMGKLLRRRRFKWSNQTELSLSILFLASCSCLTNQ